MAGCGPHVKTSYISPHDVIENEYVSFSPPDGGWYYTGQLWVIQENGKAQFARIDNDSVNGATYQMDVETWPFKWLQRHDFFDKDSKYKTILNDEEMELNDNDREQGIGYVRQWIAYVHGMKCSEGVFSRSRGGVYKDIGSKNYGVCCGYYDKREGKRILCISYIYNYAGGSIRHQKDADVPQDKLPTVRDVELRLKRDVKQLIGSLRIKNMDVERMEREGLLHHDKEYAISPY